MLTMAMASFGQAASDSSQADPARSWSNRTSWGIDNVLGSTALINSSAILSGGQLYLTHVNHSADSNNSVVTGDTQNSSPNVSESSGSVTKSTPTSFSGGYLLENTDSKVILNLLANATDYVTWASVSGLGENNRDPYQDPDHDGVINLMEYILGGLPIGSGAADTSILPTQSLQANDLVFSYERSVASKSDTTQLVQTSTDLTTWTDFATIGPVSADPVTIVEKGTETDSVSVLIPHSSQNDGKLFARLAADPNFPYLGSPPGMMELLQHWAPVVYQDVRTDTDSFLFTSRQLYGARDCIVPINFDGEWDVANNWHNSRYQPSEQGTLSDRLTPSLQAKVYTAVVESGLFYFLNYGFYHNGQDSVFPPARHQNDWEQVVIVIRKDETKFGGFETMMTQFHKDQNINEPPNITFLEQRPVIYIESNGGTKGHGIQAYTNQNPGNRGIVYQPASASQNVTSVVISTSGDWATAPAYGYKLIPIGEMWGLMNKTGLYDPYSGWVNFNYARAENYPSYEQAPQGGNPPWNRDFFMNPLVFFAQKSPALQPELATDTYVFNPYLNSSSSQAGPTNPNGVLPATSWLQSELGGSTGLAWNPPR